VAGEGGTEERTREDLLDTYEALAELEDEGRHWHHGLHRPPWKRVVLPLLGLCLVAAGLVLWVVPVVPGGVLAYLGLPLLLAAWPRQEARVRRWMRRRLVRLRGHWRRWRKGARSPLPGP
jgi:hypothetical protein